MIATCTLIIQAQALRASDPVLNNLPSSTSPPIHAESAILMDVETGRALWSQFPDRHMFPASLTKVLTALVFVERSNLDDIVIYSKKASEVGESSTGFKAGEKISAYDLLHALLLRSDNGAGHALAEHAAGSVSRFAGWMNDKAREIGATHSHFVNPHGLHHPGHYTTAADMALIAREALRNDVLREIVRKQFETVRRITYAKDLVIKNRNKLLWRRGDVDGLKTGYTRAAGRCIISSATRGKFHIVAVLMKSSDIWADASELLDYGFVNFEPHVVARRNDLITNVDVEGGVSDCPAIIDRDIIVPVRKTEVDQIRRTIQVRKVSAPVKRGEKIGLLQVSLGQSNSLLEAGLIATKDVDVEKPIVTFVNSNKTWLGVGAFVILLGLCGTVGKGARASRNRIASEG